MPHTTAQSDLAETQRIEAFSDGVFAIAITLLVLELKVPGVDEDAALGAMLVAQWPHYIALLTSFATIGIMWLNHHRLFRLIRRVDHTLLVLNALLLLGVTVVPFPTALIATHLGHPGGRVAAAVYSGTFVFVAIAFNALWRYASSPRRKPSLLGPPHDSPEVRAVHRQYAFGPLIYLAAFLLGLGSPIAGVALDLGLALFFAFPPRGAKRRGVEPVG